MNKEQFQYPISRSVTRQIGPLVLMAILAVYVLAN